MGNTPKYCPAVPCAIWLAQAAGAGEPEGVPLALGGKKEADAVGVIEGLEPKLGVLVGVGMGVGVGVGGTQFVSVALPAPPAPPAAAPPPTPAKPLVETAPLE